MYPNKVSTFRLHNPINLEFYSKNYPVFIPIRNPLDSIASYLSFYKHLGHSPTDLFVKKYAKEYINFYSHLKKYESLISILLFENFTNDLTATNKLVTDVVKEKPVLITDSIVKEKMNKSYFKLSLPRDNKTELIEYKEKISLLNEYNLCNELFNYFALKYTN